MTILPSTIIHPKSFFSSPAAGFDGVFNWEWMKGCFGNTKIMPMDFDGVVERHGNYLIFETKEIGKELPKGQIITLNNLRNPKSFTVMKIWGKDIPDIFEITLFNGEIIDGTGIDMAKYYIEQWFRWANAKKI